MSVKPRRSSYQADFVFGKRRYRRSFGTHEEAEAWEAVSIQRLLDGLSVKVGVTVVPSIDMKTLLDRTHDRYWSGARSEATLLLNAKDVANIIGLDTLVNQITQLTVDRVVSKLKERNLSNATINRKLSALSRMLRFAEERDWLRKRPSTERLRENTHRIRWMSQKEEEIALKTCRFLGFVELHDLIMVLIDTGLRLSEVLRLAPQDIDSGMIRVWHNKADYPRSVPMTTRVKEVVKNRAAGSGKLFTELSRYSACRQFQRVRDVMGLHGDDQFVLHMLRHTCASRLVQRGVSLPVVKEYLGHKSIQTTMRYAHLAPKHLADAAAVLEQKVQDEPSSPMPLRLSGSWR